MRQALVIQAHQACKSYFRIKSYRRVQVEGLQNGQQVLQTRVCRCLHKYLCVTRALGFVRISYEDRMDRCDFNWWERPAI